MYAQNSPRSPRKDHFPAGQSPTKLATNPMMITGVKASHSSGSLRNRSRRSSGGHVNTITNRSESPLGRPGDNLHCVYGVSSPSYSADSGGSPVTSVSSPSRSPYPSPSHSRSSSMSSVKSLLRDRSLDRNLSDPGREMMSSGGLPREHLMLGHGHPPSGRERSADHHHRETDNRYHTYGGPAQRDRSLDREREYPHMGARSLERDQHLQQNNLVRSRSTDYEYTMNHPPFMSPDSRVSRDTQILDLQTQAAELNKDCATLQHELLISKDKLNSSMNSIKTFWSPELKKERALRKEESSKLCTLMEQLRMTQAENRRYVSSIRELEMNQQASLTTNGQDQPDGHTQISDDSAHSHTDFAPMDTLKREKYHKELGILRKTVSEMELRIETQKQTLTARDESIKKLLGMLQTKGMSVKHLEEETTESDLLRCKLLESEQRMKKLEGILDQKELEVTRLRTEAKRSLEPALRDNDQPDLLMGQDSKDDVLLRAGSQLETLRSQDKLNKAKMENLRAELASKEAELYGTKTRLETHEKQSEDRQQLISVLREQVAAKEQQMNHLHTEVELLRGRVEEKEATIDHKVQQIISLQTERKRSEHEVNELQDHLEIKDRKAQVLTRKVESVEETLRETELQLDTVRAELMSVTADQTSHDTALSSVQTALRQRDSVIDRLKEQQVCTEQQHMEEVEGHVTRESELRHQVTALQTQLTSQQSELEDLKMSVNGLSSEKTQREAVMADLQTITSQQEEETNALRTKLVQLEETHLSDLEKSEQERSKVHKELVQQLTSKEAEISRGQAEMERILELLRQTETEKQQLNEELRDMIDELAEYRLRLDKQPDKPTSEVTAEEEARRQDAQQQLKRSAGRIEDLEEALRESVRITAEREVVMAEQQAQLERAHEQLCDLRSEVSRLETSCEERSLKVEELHQEIQEREEAHSGLERANNRHLLEVYEMKQEAVTAAISEKDAHIALLEMAPNKRTENITEVERLSREKRSLQKQLKELTQLRIKLLNQGDEEDVQLARRLETSPREQRLIFFWPTNDLSDEDEFAAWS